MFSRTFYAQHSVTKNLHISHRFSPTIFMEMQIQYPTSTLLYSSIIRLYPQNPVFEIVHDESVKVYLHMYNGNVQQNPLCVESCVTKEFSVSPLFSSTIFDPDANSVLLRAHLCTVVDSMRRKPCARNCSRKREGLYNGNAQYNPLCAASCVTKDIHISPRFSPAFLYRDANSLLLLAHLCTAALIGSMRITLRSKLFMMRAWRSIYTYMYNGNVQQNPLCVEPYVTEEFSISPRFSPIIFYPHANSVLLRAHLCTAAVDSMRRKPCVRNCS